MGDIVGPSQPESAAPTPACERCRSFKKKCSRTLPSCSLCLSAGHPCSYSQPSDARTHNRHLRARVAWLSRYIDKHAPLAGFAGGKRKIDEVDTGADLEGPVSSPPISTVPPAGNSLIQSTTPAVPPTSLHHQQPLIGQNGVSGPRPSLIHSEIDVLPQSGIGQQELAVSDPPGIGSYVPPDHPCSENGSLSGDNTFLTGRQTQDSTGLKSTAGKLVDAFFAHVGRSFPCVDHIRVRTHLDNEKYPFRIRSNDREWTILYLVMAIGANSLQRADQLPTDARVKFEIPYAEALHDSMMKPSLTSVQVLVLLSIYSFIDPKYPSTWTLSCIASRQAMELGLARRGSKRKAGGIDESEQRYRLFWGVYVLDKRMATCLGVQPMITEDNADMPLPGLTVNEFISNERNETAFSLQISQQAVQLSQLEDKILRSVHLQRQATVATLSPEARRITIREIRLEIENWYSQWCLLTPCSTDNVTVQRSVTWISARYYYLLMLLYYPTYFSICAGGIPNHFELVDVAVKYVQSVNILLQQRQVPLDRLALCRLLQAGMMLMYGFVNVPSYPAKNEVAALVEILDAYEEDWGYAHAAAHILRSFHASLNEPARGLSVRNWDSSYGQRWNVHISGRQRWVDMLCLMQEYLGPSSSFCLGLAEQIHTDAMGRPVVTRGSLLNACQLGGGGDYRDLEVGNGHGVDSLRQQDYLFTTPGDP